MQHIVRVQLLCTMAIARRKGQAHLISIVEYYDRDCLSFSIDEHVIYTGVYMYVHKKI